MLEGDTSRNATMENHNDEGGAIHYVADAHIDTISGELRFHVKNEPHIAYGAYKTVESGTNSTDVEIGDTSAEGAEGIYIHGPDRWH